MRLTLNDYAFFYGFKSLNLCGSSWLDFIFLNFKEAMIGMDKCFSMEGMFSRLPVRYLKSMIFRDCGEIAYIIALYSSPMKEK